MYGVKKSEDMMIKLDDLIKNLFAEYVIQHPVSIDSSTSSTLASNIASTINANNGDEDEGWDGQFSYGVFPKKPNVRSG